MVNIESTCTTLSVFVILVAVRANQGPCRRAQDPSVLLPCSARICRKLMVAKCWSNFSSLAGCTVFDAKCFCTLWPSISGMPKTTRCPLRWRVMTVAHARKHTHTHWWNVFVGSSKHNDGCLVIHAETMFFGIFWCMRRALFWMPMCFYENHVSW